jgi:hypothetical protein
MVRQIKARTQFDDGGNELEGCRELRFTLIGYSDPADRFLVATARAYDMTLVTADARFLRLPNLKLFSNVLGGICCSCAFVGSASIRATASILRFRVVPQCRYFWKKAVARCEASVVASGR